MTRPSELRLLCYAWLLVAGIVAMTGCSLDTRPDGHAAPDADYGPVLEQDAGEAPPDSVVRDPGSPEVCDGIDNDGDGKVDNIDAAGDGLCDCLNVCVLGEPGPWGKGDVFATWLDARSPIPARRLADTDMTDDGLAPCQVLVILHIADTGVVGWYGEVHEHRYMDPTAVMALERAVQRGMGVMTTSGYNNSNEHEVANVNRLLMPFGLSYSITNRFLDGDISDFAPGPLTDGVTKLYEQRGIEPLGGDTVARFPDGSNALVARDRVIAWTGDWETYSETWENLDYDSERFWLNVFAYLAPPQTCEGVGPVPD